MSQENKDQQPNKEISETIQAKLNSQPFNSNIKKIEPFEIQLQKTVEKVVPYLTHLWALRKKFIVFNLVVFCLVLGYLILFSKPYFNSSVTILPDYGSKEASFGQLGGLAALAGVSVGSGSPTEIYQNLIASESVLEPVIYSKYKTEEFPDSVNLIQYLKIKPDNSLSADLQNRGMFIEVFKKITKSILTSELEKLSKILTISVEMPEAQLSADVANNIVKSLDNYIRSKRKSYASEQRRYIEARLLQVNDSLAIAEDKLTYFKEQNRVINQSPLLMLEQSRLLRNIEVMNAVFLELSKQLELAKISEIKDSPILNIKEFAKSPVIKTGPHRLTGLILVMFISVLCSGTFFAFGEIIKKYTAIIGFNKNKFIGMSKKI